MTQIKIGFVGCGNMGEALLRGILKRRLYRPQEIGVTTAHAESRNRLKRRFHIRVFESNALLTKEASVLILAVKPQQMREVLLEIRKSLRPSQLLITVAAGLDLRFYQRALGGRRSLVRAMPNSPALIGEAATALFLPTNLKPKERKIAERLFETVGTISRVKRESWLDAVTAISGSGPAFFFYYLEALLKAGRRLGLPTQLAESLIYQTVLGGVGLARLSHDSLEHLRDKVTSRGGTTEAGLKVLRRGRFLELVQRAIFAATKRGRQIRRGAKR